MSNKKQEKPRLTKSTCCQGILTYEEVKAINPPLEKGDLTMKDFKNKLTVKWIQEKKEG